MSIKKVYAIDNSSSILKSFLNFNKDGKGIFDLKKIIPQDFKGKVIIMVELVEYIENSIVAQKGSAKIITTGESGDAFSLTVETNDTGVNDYYNENYTINEKHNKFSIFSSIDTPFVAKENVPASKVDIVDMAKVLNINILLHNKNIEIGNFKEGREVFDAYGALGFAIVDIDEVDHYFNENAASNDLIEDFTTTELAGELFNLGLMILCWGCTPWIYYIRSGATNHNNFLLGETSGFSGMYKFNSGKKYYSVIPGNELKDWGVCKNKKWPKIEIKGDGEYVSVELFIKKAYSQGDSNYPIPTFYINRNEGGVGNSIPLLQSNIFDSEI